MTVTPSKPVVSDLVLTSKYYFLTPEEIVSDCTQHRTPSTGDWRLPSRLQRATDGQKKAAESDQMRRVHITAISIAVVSV